jgi:magnesium chelatase subunit I
MRKEIFPFTALVGQEEMKKALVLNAVNPRIGGVLIRGEKGTAKSTAVRGLAELLPEIRVVAGCPFGCDPEDVTAMCAECRRRREAGEELPTATRKMRVVDLPVSATEDRVVGTLDIEQAIKKGEKRFEPGVLAEANRGILYVDEVNLLDDHVVDVLLDAAAMGVNTVEREGVSFTHPAQFILVGTMNPEEGELRPQLLDRFGLCVNITGVTDPALRAEIVKRCLSFEEDPVGFAAAWEEEQQRLREKIVAARRTLPQIDISDEMLLLIARTAVEMGVDGHRADLVMLKAAKTNAALAGRREVTEEDVRETAHLALAHRMRRKPFQEVTVDQEKLAGILGVRPHRQGGPAAVHTHAHTHQHTHQHGHPHGHAHGRG